jgi:hypothetical protein
MNTKRTTEEQQVIDNATRYTLRQHVGVNRAGVAGDKFRRDSAATLEEARLKATQFPAGKPVSIYAVDDNAPGSPAGAFVENVK